jgi:hypothetical protein
MHSKLFVILIVMLICSCSYGLTTKVIWVDKDASGTGNGTSAANAYAGLQTAEDAEDGVDLTALDQINEYRCISSGDTNDTGSSITFNGTTTDATRYIRVVGYDSNDGQWDDSAYVLEMTPGAGAGAIQCYDNHVKFEHLQIKVISTANSVRGILTSLLDAGSVIDVNSCFIRGILSGTGDGYAIYNSDGDATIRVFNSMLLNWVRDTDTAGGAYFSAGIGYFYNNTVYNCYRGLWNNGGTMTATNNAIEAGLSGGELVGTITSSYNCTDDEGTANNCINPLGSSWANEFTDIAGLDFSLKAGGNCVGAATTNPGSGLYDTDITGSLRSEPWSMSAFGYGTVENPPVTTPSTFKILYIPAE